MREKIVDYLTGELYGLTCFERSRGRTNLTVVREMLKGGIRIIQYREKYRSMRVKYEECRQLRELTREYKALMIVNDNIDLAIACSADGVHLGQEDMPVSVARKLLNKNQIIGLSTHNPDQAHEALKQGADYIGVGPIFFTDTKEGATQPVGLEYVDYVARHIPIPFVGIGGIKKHNMQSVVEAGCVCVALVSAITESEHIRDDVETLRQLMKEHIKETVP